MSDKREKPTVDSIPSYHLKEKNDAAPYQQPDEPDDEYWFRFGFNFADNEEDPEFRAINALPREEDIDSGLPQYEREIERIRLSRLQLQRVTEWRYLAGEPELGIEQIFRVILTLFDKKGSHRQLPVPYVFLGEIYTGLDSGKLIPDLEGIFEWTKVQGYKLFEPPCGIPQRKPILPSSERNKDLQAAANQVAKDWQTKGKRHFTKKELADELAKGEEWCDLTSANIQRIIRREW